MHDGDKTRWLVDDDILSSLNRNIQAIINCTEANDTILFETYGTLKPPTTIRIPWNLTLSGYVEDNLDTNGTFAKAKDKVMLTCPMNGPLIVARYGNLQVLIFKDTNIGLASRTPSFAIVNVIISRCSTTSDIVLLEPSCTDTINRGRAEFIHVDFNNNSLSGSGSLINGRRAQCTKLSLENVEFNQNSCDREGCVLLSSISTLQSLRVLKNRKVDGSSINCAMFSSQDKSKVDVSNMSAMHNELRIFLIWNTMLAIRESSFEANMREKSSMSSIEEIRGGVLFASQSVLSINGTRWQNNFALSGGAIYATSCEINIGNSTFINNYAKDHGGALYATSVSSKLKDCKIIGNDASLGRTYVIQNKSSINSERMLFDWNHAYQSKAGAIFVHRENNVIFYDSVFQNNVAKYNGGAIDGNIGSRMEFRNLTFQNNTSGTRGGCIRVHTNTEVVVSRSSFISNRASSGGVIYAEGNSTITLSSSSCFANKAEYGGCIYVLIESTLKVFQSTFEQNLATVRGGAIFGEKESIFNLVSTNFTANSAKESGGALHTTSASSMLKDCRFIRNNASYGGACNFYNNSLGYTEGVIFNKNHACLESGGAIAVNSNSTLHATNLTVRGNEAGKNSGGIYVSDSSIFNASAMFVISNSAKVLAGGVGIFSNSAFLCYSCVFKSNVALDGAGTYIRSSNKRWSIDAQLQDCWFGDNSASFSGGGFVFEGSQDQHHYCSQENEFCGRIVLLNTAFLSNFATQFGSAILSTKAKDVMISCKFNRGRQKDFLDRGDIRGFHSLNPKQLCKSWKGNHIATSLIKGVVGTFGKKLLLSMNSIDFSGGSQLLGNETAGYMVKDMLSGERLPLIQILVVDEFGYGPAPSVPRSFLVEITSADELFPGVVPITIINGIGNFSKISVLTAPGVYTLNIKPNITTIEKTTLKIHVRICRINEARAEGEWSCRACGENSYNFDPIGNHQCLRCPEEATCHGRYIVPKDGYWHKGPCHANVKQCIVEEACTYDNRSQTLFKSGENFTSCDLSNKNLTNYDQELCNEEYEGPLCGSCAKGFSMSGNLECLKCGSVLFSVLRLLGIILYLFIGTVLTIKGTLSIGSKRLRRQYAMTPLLGGASSSLMEEGTSAQVEGESQEETSKLIEEITQDQTSSQVEEEVSLGGNNTSQVAINEEQVVSCSVSSQLVTGVAKAQVNLIESWKILINFFQVTSTAATMDVKWTKQILKFFKMLSLLGAATINSVSRPIGCIVASSSISAKTIWRFLFNILVPTIVISILSFFWAYRSLTRHRGERFYFQRRFVLVVITVTYITYFDVSKAAVSVFNCVNVHDQDYDSHSTTRYWIVDTSIECYRSTHAVLVGISIAVLALVSVYFPLASSWALFRTKDEVQINTSRAHERLGLLCGPFKRRFVFWECVTMLKKALLSVIIVFSYSLGNQAQGLLISIVFVLFLSVHITCYPFKEDFNSLNYYESGSLLTSCITYIIVQFFNVETLTESSRSIVSIALIILNVGFVLSMKFAIVRNLVQLAKAILLSNNVEVPHNSWISIGKLYFNNRRFIATNKSSQ